MNAQKSYPGKAAVSSSKHAVWILTKSLSAEYGRQGVTAYIVAPGTFSGDEVIPEGQPKLEALKAKNPTGSLGHSSYIAGLVSYLCINDGGFVNGQLLQVNGGASAQY